MLAVFSSLRAINFGTVLLRMIFAVLCGGAIGLERSYKNRPAGFRTHVLVCIGAVVASMTGTYLYLNLQYPTDISRLGAQVVSGLGFIGAGTIIVTKKPKVKGLTTAAGLWASGIIGLAIGAGFYEGAIVATILVLLTETVFARVVQRIKRPPEFQLHLRYHHKPALDQILRHCKDLHLSIVNLQVKSDNPADGDMAIYTATIFLRPRQSVELPELLDYVRGIPGVLEVEELA